MDNSNDKSVLRARDFWTSIVLFVVAVFFLWRTSFIPLFGENRAGVSGSDWYNSAAIVPLGIFSLLALLALVLLSISIRDGGARAAFTAIGVGWSREEAGRFCTIAVTLFFYVAGLIPRVDFIISSGLLITAMIYGHHGGHKARMLASSLIVALPGAYAMVRHLPQSQWGAHDDDVVALAFWLALMGWILVRNPRDRVARVIPFVAVLTPLILVIAMAFGFRQNVPNRGGLIFKQIEYQYYVKFKPLWSR